MRDCHIKVLQNLAKIWRCRNFESGVFSQRQPQQKLVVRNPDVDKSSELDKLQ